MAIYLQEFFGAPVKSIKESFTPDLTEGQVETYIDEDSLMVDIEAIHSKVTRNCTYYSPKCLQASVPYWTNPYEIPVIMHHNEKDGEIIGRVKSAEYTERDTRSGTPALILTANIGNEKGKRDIKNGTLSTVSIGVIAHELTCSICGTNLAEEGMCEHEKGEYYDGELCYWIINKMEPKEVSYVIVPSDKYAHNIRVYDAVKKKKSEVKESVETNIFQDLIEQTKSVNIPTQEGQQVDEEVKKDENKTNPEDNQPETKEPENKEPEAKTEGEGNEADETKEGEKSEEPKDPETDENNQPEDNKEDDENKSDEGEKEKDSKEDNSELEAANEKITELEKEIEALKKDKEKLEKQLSNTKKLKESAEAKLLQFEVQAKKELIEKVNDLRTSLSLPLEDAEALMESTDAELRATIKNLTEFTQVQKKAFGINPLTSPVAIGEKEDNTTKKVHKNVKESIEHSNKSLEDQVVDFWKNIM